MSVRATNCAGLQHMVASEGVKLCCDGPSGGAARALVLCGWCVALGGHLRTSRCAAALSEELDAKARADGDRAAPPQREKLSNRGQHQSGADIQLSLCKVSLRKVSLCKVS